MIKFSPFSLCLIAFVLSVPAAEAASRCIDFLYRKNTGLLLTVPARRPKLRRPFFALGFLFCASFFLSRTESTLSAGTALLFLAPCVFLLLIITVTDAEQRLILDDTTLPLAILGLVQSIAASFAAAGFTPLLENLLAGGGGGLAFLILALLTRGGVGGGDVKLIAALGLWLGPDRLLTVVCAGLCLGGLVALFLLLTGQKKRKDAFAYGPCFTLPAIIFLLIGQ